MGTSSDTSTEEDDYQSAPEMPIEVYLKINNGEDIRSFLKIHADPSENEEWVMQTYFS